MKNEFIQYAVIEHDNYAGEGSNHIIGTFNIPETVNPLTTTNEEWEEIIQQCFEKWYKYTYNERPYPTALKWWTFESALVQVSTNKEDIISHFN